jgi:hypothetical protein
MDTYHIRIDGHLDRSWEEWLGVAALHHLPDGSTCLVRHLPDQAALYGTLIRLRDLGCTLLCLRRVAERGLDLDD